MNLNNIRIAIIGIGYVGLPLAIEFGKKFHVIAYDKNLERLKELKKKYDRNNDIQKKEFHKSKYLYYSNKINDLRNCNIFIVTVPTPINDKNLPNLKYVKKAFIDISRIIKKNDTIILESTVFPGVTEEIGGPIIEKNTNLKLNKDFFLGYSPERINPNDKTNKLTNIVKVTSGSNVRTSKLVNNLYKSIIKVGTHNVKSIKIAEAAKVIENSQRDLNIAYVNELAIIFDKLNINTNEVLKAASTKWNFLNFKPGLVGGHCIGVDPYYLTYKSKSVGYSPKIITAGRNINNNFINFIFKKSIKHTKLKFEKKILKFLILGASFKENCVDFRNSKSIELYKIFKKNKYNVDIFDPTIDNNLFFQDNKFKLITRPKKNYYNCIILSVAHNKFKKIGLKNLNKFLIKDGIFFDVKNLFGNNKNNLHL